MPHTDPTWDQYFITLAHTVAVKSKDLSTRVGCVIVGSDNEIRSTGYNGFPRGLKETPARENRPDKYLWSECAERNAIYNAALVGTSLKGCTLCTTLIPCPQCARAIVQSGIKSVIYHKNFSYAYTTQDSEFDSHQNISEQIFLEGGVALKAFEGEILEIKPFKNGRIYESKAIQSLIS